MDLENFFKLSDSEHIKFTAFIKEERKKSIASPQSVIEKVAAIHADITLELLKKNDISKVIMVLREEVYKAYLKEESQFNANILSQISLKFEIPRLFMERISDRLFRLDIKDANIFCKQIAVSFGDYANKISPYIYALCLSNTQSRRSRAGKTFEAVIYYLYNYYGYRFDAQKKVGNSVFKNLGLGKIVDSVLPGIEEFNKRRDKVIIGTMKTTLRERWQEVVEEIARSNIPNIHLLTIDDNFSINKIDQISNHNVVLVLLRNIKQKEHLKMRRNVIDFETYFLEELPEIFNYWK